MKCNHCGNEVPNDSEYCQYCGQKIEIVSSEGNNVQKIGVSKKVVGILIVICLALVSALIYETTQVNEGNERIMYLGSVINEMADTIRESDSKSLEYESTIDKLKSTIEDNVKEIDSLNSTITNLKDKNVSLVKNNQTRIESNAKAVTNAANYTTITEFAKKINIGYSSSNFYAKTSIVLMKESDSSRKITLYDNLGTTHTIHLHSDGSSAKAEWVDEDWTTEPHIKITPKSEGVTKITISNNVNNDTYGILVIVTE